MAHEGYDVEGTSLVQVNTSTFLSEQTVALPSNGGLIALYPNDHKLVATSSGGAIIVGI